MQVCIEKVIASEAKLIAKIKTDLGIKKCVLVELEAFMITEDYIL
jgi:hypothetical protein